MCTLLVKGCESYRPRVELRGSRVCLATILAVKSHAVSCCAVFEGCFQTADAQRCYFSSGWALAEARRCPHALASSAAAGNEASCVSSLIRELNYFPRGSVIPSFLLYFRHILWAASETQTASLQPREKEIFVLKVGGGGG